MSDDLTTHIDGVFTDLGRAVDEPPTWVIENVLPVGVTVIGAAPRSSKTTLVSALAALVAGYPPRTLPPSMSGVRLTGPVLVFSAEHSAGELAHLMHVGMGLTLKQDESVLVCDDPFAWRLDDPDAVVRLLRWLQGRMPRLVIIDPLREFHRADEQDSGDMNRLLRPVRRWAKANEASVCVLHHSRKPAKDRDATDHTELRGSNAILGAADATLMLARENEEWLRVAGSFKRGSSWEKTIRMAAYEYVNLPAVERLTDSERLVMRIFDSGVTDPVIISAQTKIALSIVNATLAKNVTYGVL